MFELSVIRKYLVPRKKQLSVTLIAAMSVSVIALVVWLLLVFLSVTDGIERTWQGKLTSLSAPVRITPTKAYFSSYYYQADLFSASANFEAKSIGQKALASCSDPYDPEKDPEIPSYIPPPDQTGGKLKDPVKEAYAILNGMQDLAFQEFEIGGAMLRLQIIRSESPSLTARAGQTQTFLTQASYVASFSDESPFVQDLVLPPSIEDLNQLFFRLKTEENFQEEAKSLLQNASILKLKTAQGPWRVPLALLPEGKPLQADIYEKEGTIVHAMLSEKGSSSIVRKGGQLVINGKEATPSTPLFTKEPLTFKAKLLADSLEGVKGLRDIRFAVEGKLQGKQIFGEISWDGLEIAEANPQVSFESKPLAAPLWPHRLQQKMVLPAIALKEKGILLAKSFQDSGVRIGDRGYLSYQAATAASLQEQRVSVYVAGFYDPGVMSVGGKYILAPASIVRLINSAGATQHFDKASSNGILVWFKEIKEARAVQAKIQKAFEKAGIDKYWSVSTFYDYDFAKDLLQQFHSDRILFTLIGIIILTVACSNIISLLVLLVNDKKKEIGILQAMGATKKSIACIFGGAGVLMGLASSLIGTGIALVTLANLDAIARALSALQGHDAFNAVFYGNSLPNELSYDALLFVLIATPLLSLLAGLVPAIKACRLKPSAILRSE